MKSSNSNLGRVLALGVVIVVGVLAFGGCETGGKVGDRCNPLVQQDECNSGLHCQPVTCSVAYCCPTNGPSSEPNCAKAEGCPDPDAGSAAEPDADAGDSGDAG